MKTALFMLFAVRLTLLYITYKKVDQGENNDKNTERTVN